MNKSTKMWLIILGVSFLLAAGTDSYLEFARPSSEVSAAAAKSLSMVEFMDAVRRDQVKEGVITYRTYFSDMVEISATSISGRTADGAAAITQAGAAKFPSLTLRAAGRLTDADLAVLRAHKFLENDSLTAKKPEEKKTARDLIAIAVHGASQLLGLSLGLFVGIIVVQGLVARSGSFATKVFQPVTSTVLFQSVAGCNEAKEEVAEVVDFLKEPKRFQETGGKMPKGVLLVGPPGTGKTMLAKAVAGEAKAKFYSLSGSDFVELYVGVGASRVRSLFKKARENAPSIIFIDEIDAIGRERSAGSGGHQEHEQTLNALLVAMDGFESRDAVVVFGATNRPEIIDKALLRPGRFDRQVFVGLPDRAGRHDILKVHAFGVKLDATVNLDEVAKATPGFSGADLANLINESALHAVRNRRATILMSDLDEARDKISWGRERRRVMTDADKKVIAYHEAGHALMQIISGEDSLKLHKVTIIPRGQSLGSTQFTPERDLLNYSKDQVLARIECLMAGRIAEELALGSITSGASGDIQEASRLARQMVFEWGMSPLGFLAISKPDSTAPLASQPLIHEAECHVKTLLDKYYHSTTEQIRHHRAALDAIAAALIARETISGEDVRTLCKTFRPEKAVEPKTA